MSIIDDVQHYERWLRKHCVVVDRGLRKKHKRMASDPLMFFRATCFRFARKIDDFADIKAAGPRVLSVGDAHFENWGTWRDAEGRLVWGVNDFDEAALLASDFDLIRLATSVALADGLPNSVDQRIEAIRTGYSEGLQTPGPVFVDDDVTWMRKLLTRHKAKPSVFKADLDNSIGKGRPDIPAQALAGLSNAMPVGMEGISYAARQRGGGSLGRPRFVAVGDWRGGLLVRECKAIVPSAWQWASETGDQENLLLTVATGKYRSPDPFLMAYDGFLIRRLAPDSTKIDLSSFAAEDYGLEVLRAMGSDLASVHAGTEGVVNELQQHFGGKKEKWLLKAALEAANAVREDFHIWKTYYEAHKHE